MRNMFDFTNRVLRSDTLLRTVSLALGSAAFSLHAHRRQRDRGVPRKVVHISPAYFHEESIIGGGERYATELARAMSELVETTLVTFGRKRQSYTLDRLRVEIYPIVKLVNGVDHDPLSYGFLRSLIEADVVHCHQYRTAASGLAILAAAALGKAIFVTDLGGGTSDLSNRFRLGSLVDRSLPISRFAEQVLQIGARSSIIYGSVAPTLFTSVPPDAKRGQVLFVGRLLPHKGVNYLIEAVGDDIPLELVGKPYHPAFFRDLQQLAKNKQVTFSTDKADSDLATAYGSAAVTVLPSVYVDCYGQRQEKPELLGLVLLESMASGTPVICSDAGAVPEFVEDGLTGFVVPPNDPGAIRSRLIYLLQNPVIARRMGEAGNQKVRAEYTWRAVAKRCLEAYRADD